MRYLLPITLLCLVGCGSNSARVPTAAQTRGLAFRAAAKTFVRYAAFGLKQCDADPSYKLLHEHADILKEQIDRMPDVRNDDELNALLNIMKSVHRWIDDAAQAQGQTEDIQNLAEIQRVPAFTQALDSVRDTSLANAADSLSIVQSQLK